MARDDWRIRVHFDAPEHAQGLLARLGLTLGEEAASLAKELEDQRLVVSWDEDDVFVYASSRLEAERAHAIVEAIVREHKIDAKPSEIERWLPEEERWSDEPRDETWEEDEVERGYAPWEVRIECGSHSEARELADRLEAEGYGVVRRWKYVLAGTATKEEAEELARRVHGEVEPGGDVVWETVPGNPFAIVGGLGGSGTPL